MENQVGNKSVWISVVIVVAIIGLIVYGFIYKNKYPNEEVEIQGLNQVDTQESNEAEDINNVVNNQITGQATDTDTKNMDKVAKNGDTLVMNYTGRLTDGTVFDSNVDPKFSHVEPFEFTLGAGQVIAGWDEGLVGMKVGEKKTLTITPDKAYGAQAVGPIPANSTLIFDVELVGIK